MHDELLDLSIPKLYSKAQECGDTKERKRRTAPRTKREQYENHHHISSYILTYLRPRSYYGYCNMEPAKHTRSCIILQLPIPDHHDHHENGETSLSQVSGEVQKLRKKAVGNGSGRGTRGDLGKALEKTEKSAIGGRRAEILGPRKRFLGCLRMSCRRADGLRNRFCVF